MSDRPYVLLSCAVSVDGYLDDASDERLLLSNEEDFDRVDGVRAECDAILVGAETIRRDDPRLLIRSPARRAERRAAGRSDDPAKVTLTSSGQLDPGAAFFTAGTAERLVYAASSALNRTRRRLADVAVIVDAGEPVRLEQVLADLAARGIARLMVEGGGHVLSSFLIDGLADELRLAIAPFFVGDERAPRFAQPGSYPLLGPGHPMRLASVDRLGDVVVLRYLLGR